MNKVVLMGRLTRDPELRFTNTSNTALCRFTLAVNRKFSKTNEADFINVVAWRKTAEFCGNYFKKGQQVAVVGSIQTRSWDDNEGKRHYATDVVADEAYFADSKRNDSGFAGGNVPPVQNTGGPAADNNDTGNTEGFYPIEEDDDLPF